MAMRWSRWVATVAPARDLAAKPMHDEVVALDRVRHARRRETGRDRGEPVRFLDPQLVQAAHAGRPFGEGGGDGENRVLVDHRRRAVRRHVDACEPARADAQIGDGLAALVALVEALDLGAHLEEGGEEPGPQRVHHHALDDHLRAGHDQRRDEREGRRGRVRRHDHRAAAQASAGPRP